ncbi:MAG: hypothetical protein KJ645_11000 [Planctomycetes bacterium]|nr:hypothetical protein [Planctomycetota bacterium]
MLDLKNRHGGQPGRGSIFFLLGLTLIGSGLFSAYYLHTLYREKELEIERLNTVVDRLEASTRVAQVVVTEKKVDEVTGLLETTIKFAEIDRQGKTLPPRIFTVEGDVIYFDALVIKFDRDYIERGEALRGKSLHLFRRLFGEYQPPEEGQLIDGSPSQDGIPDLYRVDHDPTDFEVELWQDFWKYATDPQAAKEKGVRIVQGEAVYTRFVKENLYTLTLDHDGGINIQVEPIPGILLEKNKANN